MPQLRKLRNIKALRVFFKVRDRVMEKTGLFGLKKRIKLHFFLNRLKSEDEKKKKTIRKAIYRLKGPILGGESSGAAFVVSLTSYGDRVKSSLPYTLYSLLKQTVLPYKIAVFLDEENWNDDSLPALLDKLKSAGVEFHYCEDLRSYKKLIPAMRMFPDNPVITVDDDFYYNPDFIAWMSDAYLKSDRKTVLGIWGCIPEKADGKYLPYNQWKNDQFGDTDSPVSFYGGYGTCYPPHTFDNEILNNSVFMKLCPTADDIWFWAMEERQGIKRKYITPMGYGHHQSVNRIYDYNVGADGCLTLSNVINGENDRQLRDVLDYYNLD